MDYQEMLQKYIVERQKSEQKLIGGEVIELTLFASWLNKYAAQQSVQSIVAKCAPDRHDFSKGLECAKCGELLF